MSLEVVKVEEGLCDGKVLFHAFEERSEAAVAAGDEKQEAARKAAAEKEARRKQQVLSCPGRHCVPSCLFHRCERAHVFQRHQSLACGAGGVHSGTTCCLTGGECQAESRYSGCR